MNICYFNDLRDLPNFGCRSTGAALELMMAKSGLKIDRIDGLDSINNSGWDYYSNRFIRIGILPLNRLYSMIWKRRYNHPRSFKAFTIFDKFLGTNHDYICEDPIESVKRFINYAKHDRYFSELLSRLNKSDAFVINGEGTLIFSKKMSRDALYILFLIELSKSLEKKIFLLNSMIATCPYEKPKTEILNKYAKTLEKCDLIVVRENSSYEFINRISPGSRVRIIPDALFSWRQKYIDAKENKKSLLNSLLRYHCDVALKKVLEAPYVTISASSSTWRYDLGLFTKGLINLSEKMRKAGYGVVLLETCVGDSMLRHVSSLCNIPLVKNDSSLSLLDVVIANSSLYISGRYHPAIAAFCADVPCVLFKSNSHKTYSVQELVGIEQPREFDPIFDKKQIDEVLEIVKNLYTPLISRYKPNPLKVKDLELEVVSGYEEVFKL